MWRCQLAICYAANSTVKDLQEANASLKRLLQAEATITIEPIPFERLKLLVIADSSLGNTPG